MKGGGRQGFIAWRDAPSAVWLVLGALVSLVHPFLPNSRWLMVHLVVLGALTHAAMVWSTHFTQALLKTGPDLDEPGIQRRRVLLLLLGVTTVLTGVVLEHWPVAVTGAAVVSLAVGWHGVQLWRRLRASIASRFRVTVRYYILAAAWVPVGATFGVLLAQGPDDDGRGRLVLAHTAALVLGWIGLTVTGTLVTLWPTMLRTRMDDRAESLARQALPAYLLTTTVIVVAAVLGHPRVAGVGVLAWLVAAVWWARALVGPARRRPPREMGSLSVAAALCWAGVLFAWTGLSLVLGPTWADVAEGHGQATAVLAAGFAPQLLLGALTYLVPVVLGGGPAAVRAANERLGQFAVTRLVLINGGLLLALLPIPSIVRVLVTSLVLGGLAWFLPLLGLAIRDSVRVRRNPPPISPQQDPGAVAREWAARTVWSSRQLVAGVATLGIAIGLGVAADPLAAGITPQPGRVGPGTAVADTGKTTTVRVEARDMRFHPASVTVPAGNRLVVDLVNTDPTTTHDLVFANGVTSPRLRPGQSATVDAGTMGRPLDGWCSIVGHRQMGMTFTVLIDGAADPPPGSQPGAPLQQAGGHMAHRPAGAPLTTAPAPVDLHAAPGPDFRATDPVLPPASSSREHKVTLTVTEAELEVAPGVWQRRWTYNGRVPGPTLRGKVGDVFVITLVNDGTMGHSIDFHAGALAPDRPMRTIPPGESLTYRFTATRSGIWMYHCSTMPMSAHIAAGMHGAVVIDPPDLPAVDREYLLVQSEVYLGPNRARGSAGEIDTARVTAETPDAVVFNGIANQYDYRPLTAKVGERVRLWVLDAGPNRATSLHIVGGQFDTTYAEGRWLLRSGSGSGGAQALGLLAAQGGFVELAFPEAGHYSIVNHVMIDAERGAHGIVKVTR